MADDDLPDVRRELARDLAGLARVLVPDDAADLLVVDALVDLTREWHEVRDLPSPRRWSRGRLARHSLRRPPAALDLPADDAGSPEQVDAARVVACVRALAPLPRAALTLELLDGCGPGEIAHALDVSVTTAERALVTARQVVLETVPPRVEPAFRADVDLDGDRDTDTGADTAPSSESLDVYAPPRSPR